MALWAVECWIQLPSIILCYKLLMYIHCFCAIARQVMHNWPFNLATTQSYTVQTARHCSEYIVCAGWDSYLVTTTIVFIHVAMSVKCEIDLHNGALLVRNKTCPVRTARWALDWAVSIWMVPWESLQTTLHIIKCQSDKLSLKVDVLVFVLGYV